jgi:hypothetical protein
MNQSLKKKKKNILHDLANAIMLEIIFFFLHKLNKAES